MSQIPFSADWLKQFSDPYAVLGLAVTADDRRALKRYRSVAKLLHPDSLAGADSETRDFATQLFARLVNPAYQKLKQEKGRSEMLATLRFRVRRMTKEEVLVPKSDRARRLLSVPTASIDTFYEQAVTDLAEAQYQPLDQFVSIAPQIEELNLVYLRLKMGEPMIREKRTGIIPATAARPLEFTPVAPDPDRVVVNYDQRHYQRAQEYMKHTEWAKAVQELRDAIRIDPKKSDYHALLGKAYLMQNLPGMAKTYFQQALKLNPRNELALQHAKQLNIQLDSMMNGAMPKDEKGGLFGGLFAKKR
ncbi:tetratricopeptide repeat protein [Microcoleus sp. FACHB-1515]|uniref:J domain-containing protein n=1 Tax=Cyanophyceae TaxID=3028117 RepID=UPI00168932AF|nr:J domain-containing protein [Microcoleus sp. FACHB-1515]MBD2092231.1 tetratricopeptide repeat protein [Microcoleus sp. FACHB-1515]